MAGPSRIDELRKKFDENPRRYFAPLANEYRKIGDFEQAIFICQEFLPQQPGHMSGHIVYGQALFETGRHDEARSVFETALALDPENLIALRHLGDIARARGDSETARAWYRRVLESDPRNEEIAGILASLDMEPAPPPASASAQESGSPGDAEGGAITLESAISSAGGTEAHPTEESKEQGSAEPAPPAPSERNFDELTKLFTSTSPSGLPSGPLQLIHEGEDLLGAPETHASPEAQPIRSSGPVSGFSAFGGDEDSAPSGFHASFLEGLTSEPPPAEPARQEEPPAPPAEARPTAQPAAPGADASTAFVTETMAELYVQQGHHDQALEVYRKLVKLHPNDPNLAARLRALEEQRAQPLRGVPAIPAPEPDVVRHAGPTIREFLELIADFRPRGSRTPDDRVSSPADVAPDTRAGSAATVGGSIHNLFTDAEQRRPAGQAETNRESMAASAPHDRAEAEQPLPGRPSTPAASELSLDHVFRHATPASGSGAQSGFSFDQFFSQQAQQDVKASDAEPAPEGGPGQPDDIQQFNAWLEGLKKT